jgi:hypothetical protein
MNHKAQMKIVFSIFEDIFNPIDFTEYIGIQPSSFYFKGDKIPNRNGLLRQESSWDYSIGFIQTLLFEDVAQIYLETFENKIDDIREYIKRYKLEAKIYIVVEIGDEETPALYFDKPFLETVHRLNAVIDIDMYK